MEKLSNSQLKKFVSSRSKYSYVIYKTEDYKKFLEKSELFLKYSRKLEPRCIDYDKKNVTNKLFFTRLSRICLGIACELLLKSAYLKKGYIINSSKSNIKKPLKFIDLEEYNNIQSNKTHSFKFLLNNFYNLFKFERKVFNFYIARGFELAYIWRNLSVHIGHGKMRTFGNDYKIVYESILYIYKYLFEEEDLIRVKKLINN